jgi:valyl-tRNA synthetase
VRFNEERVAQGRQLANKLYNASRLVLLRVPEGTVLPETAPAPATVEDAWILSRLQAAEAEVARGIDDFDFHVAALRVYDFVYGELCDWYLELLKPRLYGQVSSLDRRKRRSPDDVTRAACEFALHVLGETLALAHPLIPFVTEEIWSHLPGAHGLLMARRYPTPDEALTDAGAEAQLQRAIEAVQELRAWRDSVGAKPGKPIPARLDGDGYEATAEHVARLARLEWTSDGGAPVATVGVPRATVAIFASDAVDLEAEQRRAQARREEVESEIARAEGKLSNERFVAKAPEAVVQAERDKLARLREELAEL